MPLTPADVRNKQFSTTRLRPGYDEEEVDAFLDEIEAELDRLIQENEELRSKLAEAQRTNPPSAGAQASAPQTPAPQTSAPQTSVQGADSQPSEPSQPSGAPHSEPQADSQPSSPGSTALTSQAGSDTDSEPGGAHSSPAQLASPAGASAGMAAASLAESGDDNMQSASRMLALAQQTADQAVADARREADETLGRAQREAEETVGKARRQAEQIMTEARSRAEALERDAQERHRQAMGTLTQQRDELERKVDELRAFEHEYRTRLKAYLEDQLQELEAGATKSGPLPAAAAGPPVPASPSGNQRNGQSTGGPAGPAGPAGPFVASDAVQHASSGFRSGPDSPPNSR